MTTYEYIAITMLVSCMILFVMLVLVRSRKLLFLTFINYMIGIFIYFILICFEVLEPSKLSSIAIGVLGVIYLIAMPFF